MQRGSSGSCEDEKMNGSILVKIQDGRVEAFLNCDTHEVQKAFAPVLCEIRRVVEEGLELVKTDELIASVND